MRAGLFLLLYITLLIPYTGNSQIVEEWGTYFSLELDKTRIFYDEGLVRKAEERLIEILKKYPADLSDSRSNMLLSNIDVVLQNRIMADVSLTEFMRYHSNSPLLAHVAVLRSYLAFEDKKLDKAGELFDEAIKIAEEDFKDRQDSTYLRLASSSFYWKGVSLAIQGKYREAKPVFELCVDKYPDFEFADDAVFSLGLINEFIRQNEKAIEDYDIVDKQYHYSNSEISSMIRKINNYLILRNATSALFEIEKASTTLDHINRGDSIGLLYQPQTNASNAGEELLYLRLEAYNLAGNIENSIKSYEDFIKDYTQSEIFDYVLLSAGWAYMKKDMFSEALGCYSKIIEKESGELTQIKAAALLYKSLVLKKSGAIEEARKELSALSVMPNYPFISIVLLELGQIYYEAADYNEAEKALERAGREVTEANISARINLMLGAVYMQLKKWDKAVVRYKDVEDIALKNSKVYVPLKDNYIAEARLKQGIALVMNHLSAEAITPLQAYIADKTDSTRTDEATFWLAEAYYRSDMLKNASDTYNNLINQNPNSDRREESYYGLGWSEFRQKNFKEASIAFKKMIKEFPKSKYIQEAYTREADAYYLSRNYKLAAQSYRQATKENSKTEEGQYAAYQLCHALYKGGDFEGSINALRDFIKVYPNSPYSPYTLYLTGWIRFQQKKYSESIDNFQFLIARYSGSDLIVRAWYSIGDAYYNQGNFEKALEAYKTVIESFPGSSLATDALKSTQYCLIALGREDEAISIADSFIESNPSSPFAPEFKFKKAEMFFTGKKYSDAVSEFDNFLNKYPKSEKNPEALYWMGKSYISMNDPEKAEQVFIRLHREYPQSDDAPNGLLEWGLMLKNISSVSRADSVFQLLQTEYPDDQGSAQAGFERAVIKYNLGDTLTAMQIFKETSNTYPELEYGVQSLYRVGMYYRFKKNNDSTLVEFQKVAENQINLELAAEAQYRIGEIYLANQNFEAAKDAFVVVKDKFQGYEDWFSLSLLDLGYSYEKLDKPEEAAAIYQTLEALRGQDDFGRTAKKRLKDLKRM